MELIDEDPKCFTDWMVSVVYCDMFISLYVRTVKNWMYLQMNEKLKEQARDK